MALTANGIIHRCLTSCNLTLFGTRREHPPVGMPSVRTLHAHSATCARGTECATSTSASSSPKCTTSTPAKCTSTTLSPKRKPRCRYLLRKKVGETFASQRHLETRPLSRRLPEIRLVLNGPPPWMLWQSDYLLEPLDLRP